MNEELGDDPDDGVVIANEFATVGVRVVRTRNGVRLRIESPSRGESIELCPVELDCLVALPAETRRRLVTEAVERG